MAFQWRTARHLGAATLLAIGFVACTSVPSDEKPSTSSSGNQTSNNSTTGGAENSSQVDDYLNSLERIPVAEVKPKAEVPCEADCPPDEQDGDFYCTYSRYAETVRYDRFVAFQPNSATLWPGVVIHGRDAQYGQLNPLSVDLAPVTFSLSLENLNASPVGYMDVPSLSAFREERNKILAADVNGSTPASIDFEIRQVHNESQISVSLGAGVDWPGTATVTGNFDFTSSTKRTKILVNYTQAYYTIDVDTPTRPSAFFRDYVSVADLEKQSSNDDPPLYVQSITYGRRVLFSIESSAEADKIMGALEAAVTKASVSGEASVGIEQQKLIEESTIRAFVVGGSGASAAAVVNGFEGLVQFIQSGGDYSKESPGAPIAYKLAYLDNATAEMAFSSDYSERDCVRNKSDMRVELLSIKHIGGDDLGSHLEFHGNVSVRYPDANSKVFSCDKGGAVEDIWYMPDNSYITVEEKTTWTPSSPLFVYLDSVPIDETQQLCFFSKIREEDNHEFNPDDAFGSGEILIPAKVGWEGEHVVQVRGEGQNALDVTLRITYY